MKSKTPTPICSECGAKVVKYKHGLSKGLMRALVKFSRRGRGVINLNDCDMDLSQRTNFYKLKYWGILSKASDNERGGEWKMNPLGWSFVSGDMPLPQYVWTFHGDVVEFAGKDLFVQQITDGWKYRPDYAREAKPHDRQQSLI